MNMLQVAWLNKRPYCWVASTDGGKTWYKLNADNEDASYEAINEAAERFGGHTREWDLLDDPVHPERVL